MAPGHKQRQVPKRSGFTTKSTSQKHSCRTTVRFTYSSTISFSRNVEMRLRSRTWHCGGDVFTQEESVDDASGLFNYLSHFPTPFRSPCKNLRPCLQSARLAFHGREALTEHHEATGTYASRTGFRRRGDAYPPPAPCTGVGRVPLSSASPARFVWPVWLVGLCRLHPSAISHPAQ